MKLLATGLLAIMALLFALTHLTPAAGGWLGYARAFAEAAMVGALADWFAVTALFRHPLGIPVPHTAIVPRRKDQIGERLAQFVGEHFLTVSALQPKLASTDFSASLGRWLAHRDNARRIAADLGGLGRWLLDTVDSEALRDFVRDNLHMSLRQVAVTPLVGRLLELLVEADHHQQLMDTAVRVAREQLAENRFRLRLKIATESPWWVPNFVDEEIYDKIVGELERMLWTMGSDANHEARIRFNAASREFIDQLRHDEAVIARGEALKEELLAHPAVQRYLADVWSHLHGHLDEQVSAPGSAMRRKITDALMTLGATLQQDPPLREEINRWVRDALLYVVGQYRDEVTSVISETVRSWDPVATAERVELQVGRDLQFIRINGTLVGGLAGLAIHTVVKLLS